MATSRGKLQQTNLTKDETRSALKEAVKEWMDDQLTKVGTWTIRGLATIGLAVLAFMLVTGSGWGSK